MGTNIRPIEVPVELRQDFIKLQTAEEQLEFANKHKLLVYSDLHSFQESLNNDVTDTENNFIYFVELPNKAPYKAYNADNVEVVNVQLSQEEHPQTFKAAVADLVKGGMSEQEAIEHIESNPFQMEVYFSPDASLFLVDTMALENGSVYDPYTGEELSE